MKKIQFALIFITLIGFNSCNNRIFPKEKDLKEYPQTTFLPTLEHQITEDKNAVYAASLLYAWDELRQTINSPLQVDTNYHDLYLIHQSQSFKESLNKGEYTARATISGSFFFAEASFQKSLPFEYKLNSFDELLIFDTLAVKAFGILGHDDDAEKVIKVVYYQDDNNFIIKLLTKDKQDEIILMKSSQEWETMAEMYAAMLANIKLGELEKKQGDSSWKFNINTEDEVIIPKFAFNIRTDYLTILGSIFNSSKSKFEVASAWQRTAFLLDEYGAEVESEAGFKGTMAIAPLEIPIKKMWFDQAFFLVLKKTDQQNPYFGLWVNNSELMQKQ